MFNFCFYFSLISIVQKEAKIVKLCFLSDAVWCISCVILTKSVSTEIILTVSVTVCIGFVHQSEYRSSWQYSRFDV